MNVGDKLIELSTRALIEECDANAEIETVFRADKWESVEKSVRSADCVVFACLAVREDIEKFYPFIRDVMEQEKTIAIVAAGTALDPNFKGDLDAQMSVAAKNYYFMSRQKVLWSRPEHE